MASRVLPSSSPGAGNDNIVATAAGSTSLSNLKSARTSARSNRTRLANRLAACRQEMKECEERGLTDEDADLKNLLDDEEALELQYAEACAKVTSTEKVYDEALVKAHTPEQDPEDRVYSGSPPPPLQTSPSGGFVTPAEGFSTSRRAPTEVAGKVRLPKLKDKFRFREHNEMVGLIFYEAGLGTLSSDGQFTPTVPQTTLVTKYLQSLEGVPDVYDRAMDVAMRTHYQWSLITAQLNQAFGDRVAMRDEVARRLHSLKFKGYQYVDEFIHQLILISNMWMAVYSEGTSECRYLVSSFLAKLPADSLQGVVEGLLREIPKEGAPVWEDYVRLHSTAPPPRFSPSVDLCETIRSACKSVEITHHLQPKILADRARQVADPGPPRRGPTITDWASRFPEGTVVYFRTNKPIPLEDVRRTISSLGAQEVKAHIHKRGHRYGFASFVSVAEAAKLASEGLPHGSEGANQGLQVRAFVPGEPDDYAFSSLTFYSPQLQKPPHISNLYASCHTCSDISTGREGLIYSSACNRTESACNPHDRVDSDSPLTGVVSNTCIDPLSIGPFCESAVDCVQYGGSSGPLPEIVLAGRFANQVVQLIVDSGAGFSYISQVDVQRLGLLPSEASTVAVKVANGEQVQVSQVLKGQLSLTNLDGESLTLPHSCEVRILPTVDSVGASNVPSILLGRDLQRAFKLVIDGGERVFYSGLCIFDAQVSRTEPMSCSCVQDHVCSIAPVKLPDLRVTHPSADLYVTLSCPSGAARGLHELCESMCIRQPFGPDDRGYASELRRLPEGEVPFPAGQQYAWSICCPSLRRQVPVRHYAHRLYDKLCPDACALHQELVDGYVSRGFWTPTDTVPPDFAEGEVFMVGGPSSGATSKTASKGRLVCDLRESNEQLPPSSTCTLPVVIIIAALRTACPPLVIAADVHSAFYMLRLCGSFRDTQEAEKGNCAHDQHQGILPAHPSDWCPLCHRRCLPGFVLHCGDGKKFISLRVCFGCLFGPESLECSLGRQIRSFRVSTMCDLIASGIAYFVDDLLLHFSSTDATKATFVLSLLLCFLSLCGFAISILKFAVLVHQSACQHVTALREYTKVSMLVLGILLSYDSEGLVVDCNRRPGLEKAKRLLESTSWSRQIVYRIGGALGVDKAGLHAEIKPLCDAARRLFGRVPRTVAWTTLLSESDLTPPQRECWLRLRQHMLAYIEDGLAHPCRHSTPICPPSEIRKLVLQTDSSGSGGGYYIYLELSSGREVPLVTDSWIWSPRQTRYHSNRRELISLFRGVSGTARLVQQLQATQYKSCKPLRDWLHVVIECDNAASVRWCQTTASTLKVTAVERDAIIRLVGALGSQLHTIKAIVPYDIRHLAGAANKRADGLSRVLESPIPGTSSTLHSLLRAVVAENDPAPKGRKKTLFETAEAQHAEAEHDADTDWCSEGCPGHTLPVADSYTIYGEGVRLVSDYFPFVTPELQTSAFVDHCRVTREVAADDPSALPQPLPLVRRLKECSWGAGDMFYMVAVMRWTLRAWKKVTSEADTEPVPDYPTVWDRRDLLVVARSDQVSYPCLPPCSEVGRGTGPYFRIDQVIHLRSAGPTGVVEYKPYVSPYLRDILIRDIHRVNDHCCPSYARAQFNLGYCSTRVTESARQMCRKQCALCIRFARKAKWTLPVGGPMFDIRALLTSPSYRPYEVVGIDYVTVEGVKVVSFCCAATRHMTLVYTPTESTTGLIMAFQEFIMMWGTPRLVLSDRASYFRSVLWLQFLKSHNIQSWLNASVAPWEGSFYERLHGIVRTILRPILLVPYSRRMLREFDPHNVSDVRSVRLLLLEVGLLLNTRPLTVDCEDGVITPDSLVQGYTRVTSNVALPSPLVQATDEDRPIPDCVTGATLVASPSAAVLPALGPDTAPRRVGAVRRVFLDYHFRRLKERSNAQFKSKDKWRAFEVGSPVFIQAAKSIVPARILEAFPARDGLVRRYKVRFLRSNKETVISHANIAAAFPWETLRMDDDI